MQRYDFRKRAHRVIISHIGNEIGQTSIKYTYGDVQRCSKNLDEIKANPLRFYPDNRWPNPNVSRSKTDNLRPAICKMSIFSIVIIIYTCISLIFSLVNTCVLNIIITHRCLVFTDSKQ